MGYCKPVYKNTGNFPFEPLPVLEPKSDKPMRDMGRKVGTVAVFRDGKFLEYREVKE